jgi:hypothetical protein
LLEEEAEPEFLSLLGISPADSLVRDMKGFRKARSTASLIFWSWAASQSTMKRAIMAVTKSAYATFQAPP